MKSSNFRKIQENLDLANIPAILSKLGLCFHPYLLPGWFRFYDLRKKKTKTKKLHYKSGIMLGSRRVLDTI